MMELNRTQGFMPDELDNLHGPTEPQAERVAGYMSGQIDHLRKGSKYINIGLIVFTVIMIAVFAVFASGLAVKEMVISGAMVIVLCVAACYNVHEDVIFRRVMQAFMDGQYFVVEGYVREYEPIREDNSVIDLRFETKDRELLRGAFTLCGKGVTRDTELLAVYMPRENIRGAKYDVVTVLTPYLMTEAGWTNRYLNIDIWYREA